jgi:enoyl-CoA hydratase
MSNAAQTEKPNTRVELEHAGNVCTVRFSCDTGVNVFSSHVLGALTNLVEQLRDCPKTRFVVFRGTGRTFLAGADIAEMSHFTEDDGQALAKHGHHVFNAIESLPQVTFAALNGHAMGGGCELAMACDFRVMTTGAKIGQPESRLGLIPGWGGTIRLPRLVGLARARRMLYGGETIPADEALRIGLVDDVVASPDGLDAALARWFATLKPGSPAAIRRIKHALREHDEIKQFSVCFSCSDAEEGMHAFLEKRPPEWAT